MNGPDARVELIDDLRGQVQDLLSRAEEDRRTADMPGIITLCIGQIGAYRTVLVLLDQQEEDWSEA